MFGCCGCELTLLSDHFIVHFFCTKIIFFLLWTLKMMNVFPRGLSVKPAQFGSVRFCSVLDLQFPFKLSRDITEITPLWETPSLQPFLKTYWLTPVNDWPIVAKHANMTSSRGSINAAPATIRQNLFLHFAEPRLWLKMLQLTVKVRSFEGRPHGCSSAAFR